MRQVQLFVHDLRAVPQYCRDGISTRIPSMSSVTTIWQESRLDSSTSKANSSMPCSSSSISPADRPPFVRHVHMAGAAGAETAAITLDTRDQMIDRALHDAHPDRNLHVVLGAVGLDIGDLRH